jgi:Domain of unknown function (DUF4328)/Protein of unknown function (DUF2510)
MQPGWYPDPFGAADLRWFDGRDWTGHTAKAAPQVLTADPRADLASEQRAARRASIAVVVWALIGAANALLYATVFSAHDRHTIELVRNGEKVTTSISFGDAWPFALLTIGATVFVMIWLHRAASLARKAGFPASRDPVWAVLGFIIPIVNFWFPYQVARDCFASNDQRRRIAGLWWTFYLIATLGSAVVGIASLFSVVAGVAFAAVDTLMIAFALVWWRRLIAAISDAHHDLVGALTR